MARFNPNQGWITAAAESTHFKRRLRVERARKLMTMLRLYPHRLPRTLADRRALDASASSLEVTCGIGHLRLDNPNSAAQLREILIGGAYAAPGFVPRSGWTVVDLGANLGFFSAWAMSFMRSGSILAVEAVPSTFAIMDANVRGTKPSGVTVRTVNLAVTDTRRNLEFAVPDGYSNFAGAAAHVRYGIDDGDIRVTSLPGDSLDNIFATQFESGAWPPVDLLKIDVEGSEADCLKGASAVLEITQRVVFEYHSEGMLTACSEVLRAAGFRQRSLRPGLLSKAVGNAFWSR